MAKNNTKGKAPAFQFYVKDWLCDPELRLASVLSRGAWIDCLCFMWENSQRGKLTATPLKFSRLISGSLDEALHFLNDLYYNEFGDIEVPEDVSFPLTEAECNIKVTIINRRMYNDYKDKQNTRLRVRRHREKKKVTPEKQECNADVTGTSPSSSSSPSSKQQQHPSGDFFKNANHIYFKSIESSTIKLLKLPISVKSKPFNPCEFTNWAINTQKYHPGAVDYTLQALVKKAKENGAKGEDGVKDLFAYGRTVLKTANGNFCERDHIKDYEALKQDFNDFIDNSKQIQDLLKQVF